MRSIDFIGEAHTELRCGVERSVKADDQCGSCVSIAMWAL